MSGLIDFLNNATDKPWYQSNPITGFSINGSKISFGINIIVDSDSRCGETMMVYNRCTPLTILNDRTVTSEDMLTGPTSDVCRWILSKESQYLKSLGSVTDLIHTPVKQKVSFKHASEALQELFYKCRRRVADAIEEAIQDECTSLEVPVPNTMALSLVEELNGLGYDAYTPNLVSKDTIKISFHKADLFEDPKVKEYAVDLQVTTRDTEDTVQTKVEFILGHLIKEYSDFYRIVLTVSLSPSTTSPELINHVARVIESRTKNIMWVDDYMLITNLYVNEVNVSENM